MIVILHKDNKVVNVFDYNSKEEIQAGSRNLFEVFFDIGKRYKSTLIIWCHYDLKDSINQSEFNNIFHHKLIMASFNTKDSYYIGKRIGYVESSPFINVNKKVTYPTWLMSSCIGGVNSDVLSSYK